MSEISTSQELGKKLSRSPVLGAHGHLASTGASPGLGGPHHTIDKHGPRSPGTCPCLAHWGNIPSRLSSEQGWLEFLSGRTDSSCWGHFCGGASDTVTDPWSLGTAICHSKWGVYYLPRDASGHACLGARPELTDPPELMDRISPLSALFLSGVPGARLALFS